MRFRRAILLETQICRVRNALPLISTALTGAQQIVPRPEIAAPGKNQAMPRLQNRESASPVGLFRLRLRRARKHLAARPRTTFPETAAPRAAQIGGLRPRS